MGNKGFYKRKRTLSWRYIKGGEYWYKNRVRRTERLRIIDNGEKIKRGGCCQICGYNQDLRALTWHHKDRTIKEYGVSRLVGLGKISKYKKEIIKCVLICANCHIILNHEFEDNKRNAQ